MLSLHASIRMGLTKLLLYFVVQFKLIQNQRQNLIVLISFCSFLNNHFNIKVIIKNSNEQMFPHKINQCKAKSEIISPNIQSSFKLIPICSDNQAKAQSQSQNFEDFAQSPQGQCDKFQQILKWFQQKGIVRGCPEEIKDYYEDLNKKKLFVLMHTNSWPGQYDHPAQPMSPLYRQNQAEIISKRRQNHQQTSAIYIKRSPKKENIPSPVKKCPSPSPVKQTLKDRRKLNNLKLII